MRAACSSSGRPTPARSLFGSSHEPAGRHIARSGSSTTIPESGSAVWPACLCLAPSATSSRYSFSIGSISFFTRTIYRCRSRIDERRSRRAARGSAPSGASSRCPWPRSPGLRASRRRLSISVLVTGGAGFIGSHLVDRLIAEGRDVTVLDDLSTGSSDNLAAHERGPKIKFIRGSVLDAALVDDLVSANPLVFHLAAAVGVRNIVEDPLGSLLTNVNGTEHVLAAASRHGA